MPTLVMAAPARHHGSRAHGDDVGAPAATGASTYCPNGSHLAIFDDQQTYMSGLIDFIHDVDTNH